MTTSIDKITKEDVFIRFTLGEKIHVNGKERGFVLYNKHKQLWVSGFEDGWPYVEKYQLDDKDNLSLIGDTRGQKLKNLLIYAALIAKSMYGGTR